MERQCNTLPETDWSDRVRNLAIAAAQVATILMVAEHLHWSLLDWLRQLRARYERWLRQQQFELFYSTVWPRLRGEDGE